MNLTLKFGKLLLLAMFPLLSSCAKEQPPLLYESEYFRYFSKQGLSGCADPLRWFDSHWKAHAAYLGLSTTPPQKFEFYNYLNQTELFELGCTTVRADSDGCFQSPNVIFSVREYYAHELIHAYMELLGRPPRLFVEGIANYLDCTTTAQPRAPPLLSEWNPDWLSEEGYVALLTDRGLEGPYELALSFVGHLVRRRGIQAFERIYSSVATTSATKDVIAALEREYGPFDRLIAEWRDEATNRPFMNSVQCIAECASPMVDELSQVSPFVANCSLPRPDILGAGTVRRFSLDKETTLRLRISSAVVPAASVRIESCDGREVARPNLVAFDVSGRPPDAGAAAELWATLLPGEYFAAMSVDPEPGPVTLGIEELPPPSLTCPSTPGIPSVPASVRKLYYFAQPLSSASQQGSIEFRRSNFPGRVRPFDQFVQDRKFLGFGFGDGGFAICLREDPSVCGFPDEEVYFAQTPPEFELCSCAPDRQCGNQDSFPNLPSFTSSFEVIPLRGDTVSMTWKADAGSEISFGFNFDAPP